MVAIKNIDFSENKDCLDNKSTEQKIYLKNVTLKNDHHKLYVGPTNKKRLSNFDERKLKNRIESEPWS